MLKSVSELREISKNVSIKKMAVVFAQDDHVMEAVKGASDLGIVKPVLIGDAKRINELIKQFDLKEPFEVINELDGEKASRIACDMVNNNEVDIIMKGLIDTKVLLKQVVNNDYGIKDAKLLSHVGIVSYPTLDRILYVTDGAMNITPNVDQKIMIIESAVKLANSLGNKHPKVGIVSAVEKVNPKIQSTLDAKEIVEYYKDKDIDFLVDGPFAIDNLVSMDSVKHKGITSPVGGKADILLFPNLDGGNIFYKTSVFLANGKSAGIILGAKVPIVLTSRADSAEAKLNSILLAVVNKDGLLTSSR
jgi:phosphate butyryltransferase